jgi:formylglycine-generating enzyme required for sulfatase activity
MITRKVAIALNLAVGIIAAAFLCGTESKSDDADKPAPAAVDPMVGQEASQERADNGLKMKLVWCPRGFVTMENIESTTEPAGEKIDETNEDKVGPKDQPVSKPRRKKTVTPVKVFLTRGYWLGKCEVTQSEWKEMMATEPWRGKNGVKEGADFPATFISWDDAADFCRRLTDQEHRAGRLAKDWEYRLPTEAEWERACRARTETRFSFGADTAKLADFAWTTENTNDAGEPYAHRVGQKNPNQWGLCDMYGNVAEWCRDSYVLKLPGGLDPDVQPPPQTDAPAIQRVIRGGCFDWDAMNCGSAIRSCTVPSSRFSFVGFRVALCRVR